MMNGKVVRRLEGSQFMELPTAKIRELGWGDASLFGFAWENDGKDLRLFLLHASLPISQLLCRWASDLRVDLTWHRPKDSTDERPLRRGGPLLTWDGSIEPTRDGRWSVFLDFASDGEIRLECEEIVAAAKDAV
jgi:hypothetical protein